MAFDCHVLFQIRSWVVFHFTFVWLVIYGYLIICGMQGVVDPQQRKAWPIFPHTQYSYDTIASILRIVAGPGGMV